MSLLLNDIESWKLSTAHMLLKCYVNIQLPIMMHLWKIKLPYRNYSIICQLSSLVTTCVADEFECKATGLCIPISWYCDGTPDCIDADDEIMCISTTGD